ncbi:MAG: hypothetical protein CVU01_04395 [Bacteroidetes bacterium HGW-Bacteroidetes-18]|nr:MAG: hypothetical protein CVU01_04395 [Bacteroidetes bacterium HGW-Bacteroidetes-18]
MWLFFQRGWAIAQSPILGTTITLKRLKQRGYKAMVDIYIILNPSFYSLSRIYFGKPPYT